MSTPPQTPDPDEQPEQERAEEQQPAPQQEGGRRGKSLVVTLTTLGVAVLLGVAGVLAFGPFRSNITEAASNYFGPDFEKGDCLNLVDARLTDFEEEKVECGSDASDYEIVKHLTGDAKCSDDRAYEVLTVDSDTYCMVLDVTTDDCLWVQGEKYLDTKVDCGSENATWSVTKVADKSDESVCSPGEYYATYPEPSRTVCMKDLTERG
ncbi:hypothetical protein CDG81_02520 [Actinopolyspora erythraea]|uniref:Pyridine nucleotide-disulfide oxidoreductase n=1 Tax=Actinopolyspora erythraea TaxID=414996 RepID=A0A099D1S1_9ACTN|nr:hypothetical protein [Actinopolyspora erythraea]ASU77369.1 hypothetical protein CDG81_02520 [Actinopolyspora erythraea]KGI80133.1 hypothetical protein IL38_18455 [Actinopolyspora erythraea]